MRAGGRTRAGRRSSPFVIVAAAVLAVLAAACTQDPAATLAQGEAGDPSAAASAPQGSPSPEAGEGSPAASPPGVAAAETPSPEPRPSVSGAPSEPGPSEPGASEPGPSEGASGAPDPAPAQVAGLDGLAEGARGEPVRALQQRLNDLGYKVGPADGAYGRRTTFGVKALQHDSDLPTSGTMDAATAEALRTATATPVLEPGSSGPAVVQLQQRLNDGPFDVGPPDGEYGTRTAQGVYALQKLHGYPADGAYSAVERYLLDSGANLKPRLVTGPEGQRGLMVEVDLSSQLLSVYRDGKLELAVHTSTGSGETFCTPAGGCRRAVTPPGSFTIGRRIDGWRTSELGKLYNPLYFNGGIALHGAPSVPLGPASHGCVRLPMHIAEYAPDLLPDGTPVIVG